MRPSLNTLDVWTDKATNFGLTFYFNGTQPAAIVDYGDGTTATNAGGTVTHTYAGAGRRRVRVASERLSKIYYFDMQSMSMRLELPSFAACTELESLYANDNQFIGEIPSFAANTKLKNLVLGSNQFRGRVPLFVNNPALLFFSASDNFLTGEIPSFANCPLLTSLYLAHNNLSGTLPSFATNTNLVNISASAMPLTGTLPSFAACTKLAYCHLGACDWTGTMPSFATCPDLYLLDLNKANFTGTLPSFAANTKLKNFWCNLNQLSSTIPNFAPCTLLENWEGDFNQFSDYTAGSFATQKNLALLNLQTNNLPQSAIDNILADLVTSLSIPSRVICSVNLSGAGNAAPSGAGATSKATLVSAWGAGNVTTN